MCVFDTINTSMDNKLFNTQLSTCWLIGAYFLAVSSHKRGRLNTSVYGSLLGKYTENFKILSVAKNSISSLKELHALSL